MSRKEPLFTFRLTGLVLALLRVSGERAAQLLASVRLPESAATEACTVPLSRVRAFMDEAALRARDPLFGLHLVAAVPEGTYEAAELLVRTAGTVGAGLRALSEHAALVNPIGHFNYDDAGERAELHYLVPGRRDGLGAQMNEYTLAFLLRGLRRVAAHELPLLDVWFSHERSAARDGVSAHFGVPARFGAATCGFALSHEAASAKLGSGDRVVFEYLARQAKKARVDSAELPFSAQVTRALGGAAGFSGASLATVSKHLGVTPRTAQRRLSEEGTQFRDVLEQARRRRAEELASRGVKDDRIAELLGFADTGTYRRASRRWQVRE